MSFPENDISEFNLYSLFNSFRDSNSIVFVSSGQYHDSIKAIDSHWPNAIFNLNEASFKEENFQCILSEIKSKELFPLLICNEKLANIEFLRKHFFLPIDIWVKMSVELEEINGDSNNSELLFKNIEDELELNNVANLVSEELFKGKKVASKVFKFLLDYTNTLFFGLYLNSNLIGTAMVFIDENGVAGYYMVCVKSVFRGKGYGKTLMKQSFKWLKTIGVKKCTLQSTAAGLSLYKSLGFIPEGNLNLFWKIK